MVTPEVKQVLQRTFINGQRGDCPPDGPGWPFYQHRMMELAQVREARQCDFAVLLKGMWAAGQAYGTERATGPVLVKAYNRIVKTLRAGG